jgi:hypothetical protein
VKERIFKLGDIRDPISRELVVAKEYRNQMDQVLPRFLLSTVKVLTSTTFSTFSFSFSFLENSVKLL